MSTSDILAVAGLVLGLVGIAVSYYFYRRSLRDKEPCWDIRSSNIIQGYQSKITGVEVLYRGELVDNVTVSKVLFWNKGAITIDNRDIETKNHLRIVAVGEAHLLDAKVISQNHQSNQVSISPVDNNSAYIMFEYLDKDNGVIIQV